MIYKEYNILLKNKFNKYRWALKIKKNDAYNENVNKIINLCNSITKKYSEDKLSDFFIAMDNYFSEIDAISHRIISINKLLIDDMHISIINKQNVLIDILTKLKDNIYDRGNTN